MHMDHEHLGDRRVSAGGHARWVGEQLADGRLLELGEREMAGRTWRVRRLWRRRLLYWACAVGAISCACVGVALLITPPTVTVSMGASTYRIGDAVLRATSPGIYTGEGVVVIRAEARGIRAAGSAVVNGRLWAGACEVSADGSRETCQLQQGRTTLMAVDVWADAGWQRTYSDGQRLRIDGSNDAPVPFPVGR